MSKRSFRRLEFHITNTCNLNCQGCDSFSNYNISANHETWAKYESVYAKWAHILDIDEIGVQGGEPMANPDYRNWLIGLRRLWPRAMIWLATNGTLLHKPAHQDLYQLCQDNDIGLIISFHNQHNYDRDLEALKSWLTGPMREAYFLESINVTSQWYHDYFVQGYQRIKDSTWPDCGTYAQWLVLPEHIRQECQQQHHFEFLDGDRRRQELLRFKNIKPMLVDDNEVKVQIKKEWNFWTPPVGVVGNQFQFSVSDPVRAHEVCIQSQCHQFYQGALHKCASSHIFKDIVTEFDTNLSSSDLDLIMSYAPAQADWSPEKLEHFFDNMSRPMDMCRVCPETVNAHQVEASLGQKVHLLKII